MIQALHCLVCNFQNWNSASQTSENFVPSPHIVWKSDKMSKIRMCSVPTQNSQTSYQFSCQSCQLVSPSVELPTQLVIQDCQHFMQVYKNARRKITCKTLFTFDPVVYLAINFDSSPPYCTSRNFFFFSAVYFSQSRSAQI